MESALLGLVLDGLCRRWTKSWGLAALVGFLLALVVHIATVCGVDVSDTVPYVWALHVGIFLAFAPMVVSASRRGINAGEILGGLPVWAIVLEGAVFAYLFVNAGLCLRVTQGGNAFMIGGQYILASHGHVLAHLTEAQYHLQRAYQVRLFSGFWLPFYLAPALYFLGVGTRDD